MIYYHILAISDNTISNITQKINISKYNDKYIRKTMIYIIVGYIIVCIAGIYVGIFIMTKREVILKKMNIWKTKDVPIML